MRIRILTAGDVRAALSMPAAIETVKRAFAQFSADRTTVPLRSRLHTPDGVTLLMPAFLHDSGDFAIKIVSVYGDNPKRGLPTVTATVFCLDPKTGLPLAIMDGDALTALRTGAAGVLAASLLAREDAEVVTLFGAGVQGAAQVDAVMSVRAVRRIDIVDPNADAAQKLADILRESADGVEISVSSKPEASVRASNIVITATTSRTPVFDGAWLNSGTHVTAVGSFTPEMREIDETTVRRARVVVDSRDACTAETGDITRNTAVIDAEIGDIVNGTAPGRESDDEITLFKSVGIAAQDAAAASAVLAEAEKQNLGEIFRLSEG